MTGEEQARHPHWNEEERAIIVRPQSDVGYMLRSETGIERAKGEYPTDKQMLILADVADERERQDRIWGGKDHDSRHTARAWRFIASNEGAAFRNALTEYISTINQDWATEEMRAHVLARVRDRAINLAAVMVAITEHIDNGAVAKNGDVE